MPACELDAACTRSAPVGEAAFSRLYEREVGKAPIITLLGHRLVAELIEPGPRRLARLASELTPVPACTIGTARDLEQLDTQIIYAANLDVGAVCGGVFLLNTKESAGQAGDAEPLEGRAAGEAPQGEALAELIEPNR